MRRKTGIAVLAAAACVGAASVGALAAAPQLALFGQIKNGKWEIRDATGAKLRNVCLRDPTPFLQIEHGNAACSRYVIEDTRDESRVSYSCNGRGHGVTSVRRETDWLVRIESQGIKNGSPFQGSFEARRVGGC